MQKSVFPCRLRDHLVQLQEVPVGWGQAWRGEIREITLSPQQQLHLSGPQTGTGVVMS